MKATRTWRWLAGAAVLSGALALRAHEAQADKRIQVWLQNNRGDTCQLDPQGNRYVGESIARNALNQVVCQAISSGGTAMAYCPNDAVNHQGRIIKRTLATWDVTGSALQSTPVLGWNTASEPAFLDIPAGTNCPGGAAYWVASLAKDVP